MTAQNAVADQTVKGVIARAKGEPVELVDVVVPAPDDNDVIVKIQACGVCHTGLAYRDGGISDDYPFLLGHEAAGVVEAVGSALAMWNPETTLCSTGAQCAVNVVPAARANRSTASTLTTPAKDDSRGRWH